MCGLCGIAYCEPIDQIAHRLDAMSASIAHRGPDGQGTHIAEGIAVAHRRLSILELTQAGAQPMRSADGRAVIVFNGEIFNFRTIRAELLRRGHKFVGGSDTEVILAAYREWGQAGLERLEGMFAFALWDAQKSCLILMRDRLGIKPLFYSIIPTGIVFGSEIKAVLASGLVQRTVDRQAMSEFLWFGNAHEDRTIYSQVRCLQPGHRLIWLPDRCNLERWWGIEQWLDSPDTAAVRADPIGAVRESVGAAVGRQMLADVPVGLFLSGGVDSTAIAVAAAGMPGGAGIRTFAAGFGAFGSTDERPKARRVAEVLGLPHEAFDISAFDIEAVVRKMVDAHDEPFADAANIPLYVMASRVSDHVKVVLQGDGGDEVFAGYRRYLLLRHIRAWRSAPSFALQAAGRAKYPFLRRLARLATTLKLDDPAMRMALLLTTDTLKDSALKFFSLDAARRLMTDADPFLAYRRAAERFASHDPVTTMLLTDMTVQLPSQFLPKVDRATMASGVEARVPLLDEIVCRTALSLPLKMKVRGLQKKVALRAMLRDQVPDGIIDAPKTGFSVPYEAWLAGPLRTMADEALLSRTFVEQFQLDAARVRTGLNELNRGDHANGYQIWKLAQFALWAEKHRYELA